VSLVKLESSRRAPATGEIENKLASEDRLGPTRMRVLYISYDGLMEPLGQSQVLQYLKLLAHRHEISLITFEKAEDWNDVPRRTSLIDEVADSGIRWTPLRYHRAPSVPATAFDVLIGLQVAAWMVRSRRIQIVHARSYVPALIALFLKRWFGVRFVFDMRGFWADEKVDSGTWRHGSAVYRGAKKLERTALLEADVVVSLTRAGVEAMRAFDYLRDREICTRIIPTCTNLELFHAPAGEVAVPSPGFRLGYVGNVAGWYCLDPVLIAFEAIRTSDPAATLTFVNRGQHEIIQKRLAERILDPDSVTWMSADYRDVPDAIRGMHATAFFIKPVFSKLASAPTKLGEFLGCGVPCLINAGVGDMGTIVREEGVGVVVDSFEPEVVADGARRLVELVRDPDVRARCILTAYKYFSLAGGVSAYDDIYRSLPGRRA
jgi:glycosyltransferase involved in cell wall biosynthesis